MSLEKQAQHIEVFELPLAEHMTIEPENVLTVEELPEKYHDLMMDTDVSKEVSNEPEEFEVIMTELPGVDELDPELEKTLEVSEDEDTKKDKNDLAQKPMLKWDWEARWKKDGATGFFAWAKEILEAIPKHSGYDEAGLHRAISYLERFLDEISKAMKKDLDGELDANKIEKLCSEAEDGIDRLEARLDKIKSKKKTKRTKKAETEQLVKTAQKAPNVVGIVITVPLLISKIARICINGMVSAGGDIEEIFNEQVKKYNLNDREQAELMMHLADLGVPMYLDRGFLRDEDRDMTQHGFDFMGNYQA